MIKKIFKIIFIVLIILLLIAAIITGVFAYNKMKKINYTPIDESKIEITPSVKENTTIANFRNIAILGVDSRIDTYDSEGSRSDCIIIASLNSATNEVKFVSVYRDTYLNIEGYGLNKVNSAYSLGGPELAISTLNTNLDLNITEFVTVNFFSTIKMVDAVNGVNITLDSDEIKYINPYINHINSLTDGYNAENIYNSGTYLLNGKQALAYSRIRYTEGWDYKRQERIKNVMLKVFDKVKTMSTSELNTFADNMLGEISTNISSSEIIGMLPKLTSFKITNDVGFPYNIEPYDTTGLWYGVPVDLTANVSRLHKELFGVENYVVSNKVKEISDMITEDTGI